MPDIEIILYLELQNEKYANPAKYISRKLILDFCVYNNITLSLISRLQVTRSLYKYVQYKKVFMRPATSLPLRECRELMSHTLGNLCLEGTYIICAKFNEIFNKGCFCCCLPRPGPSSSQSRFLLSR